MIEMQLVGVRVELPTNQPIVLLKEKDGERYLPIFIGAWEAQQIAFGMQGAETPRPMPHDLMRDMLGALGVAVQRILITELRDQTFFAEIQMIRDGTQVSVSSRPSDAIALAVRLSVPIYANEEVLEEASVAVRDDEDEDREKEKEETELRQFREFLEHVNPEDFK